MTARPTRARRSRTGSPPAHAPDDQPQLRGAPRNARRPEIPAPGLRARREALLAAIAALVAPRRAPVRTLSQVERLVAEGGEEPSPCDREGPLGDVVGSVCGVLSMRGSGESSPRQLLAALWFYVKDFAAPRGRR